MIDKLDNMNIDSYSDPSYILEMLLLIRLLVMA
jgi:hypothetical protein